MCTASSVLWLHIVTCTACVSCTVLEYTVSSRLHKVTWYECQLKKWVVIGLLLIDQYVVPVV